MFCRCASTEEKNYSIHTVDQVYIGEQVSNNPPQNFDSHKDRLSNLNLDCCRHGVLG